MATSHRGSGSRPRASTRARSRLRFCGAGAAMPSAPDLQRTQRLFWELITAPEGVAAGIEDLSASGLLPAADPSFFVAGVYRVDATGRLELYAHIYLYP